VSLSLAAACDQESVDPLVARDASAGWFEGEFVTRIATLHDGTSRTTHHLVDRSVGKSIRLDVEDPEAFGLHRGAIARAYGEQEDDGSFSLDHVEVVAPPPQKTIDPTKRDPRRVAFVMANWDGPDGLAKEVAKQKMFLDNESTNVYYQQISYGEEQISGNVFGWFDIPNPGGCDPDGIAYQADNAMEAAGYSQNLFRQFMYYFPSTNCDWAGLANLGAPDDPARNSWYNGASGCVVRNQELGHNYGMVHSKSVACVDAMGMWTPYSADCTFEEYGDPYDPMGGGCYHMNMLQKGYMGWMDGCNGVNAPVSGTYNLVPMELPCNGLQSLRLPIAANNDDWGDYYYIEYRRPIGDWDNVLSGVLLRIGEDYRTGKYGGPNGYIIDAHDGPGAFLHAGDTYDDYLGRVSFTVVEENETHAVIQVTYPNGGSGAATCLDMSTPPMELGNIGSIECAAEPVGVDDSPPTVAITYPMDGDSFDPGASFDLTADAMDDRGIIELELYVDGQPVAKDITPPFSWPVNQIPEGTYQFGVVARDTMNYTASSVVNIVVGAGAGSTGGGGGSGGSGGTTAGSGGTGSGSGGSASASATDSSTEGSSGGSAGAGNTSSEGCGCSSAAGAGSPWLLGLGAAFWARPGRRRRRLAPAG
jgi:MYXO-CTERM domain-containing protein